MKSLLQRFLLYLALFLATACASRQQEEGHAHNADGSHPGETGLQPLSYTLYSPHSELFVEFKPLVVGQTSRFAAHLTLLGEHFEPYTSGKVTVSLLQGGKGIRQTADSPASRGIFRLALQPGTAGTGTLVFDIETKAFRDRFVLDSIPVYVDEPSALAAAPAPSAGTDISFLKEQAWKIDFATTPVRRGIFYDVIKTTGELQAAPGQEVTLSARTNGIVRFLGPNNIAGYAVQPGQAMFAISGGEIPFENVDAARAAAHAEEATAKAEFERASELIKDQLITRTDFEKAKLRYEQARIESANLERNYSAGGKRYTAPIRGFIRAVMVSEGQYVTAGQPLAILSNNRQMVLRADLSLRDVEKIRSIRDADFTLPQNKQTYRTADLNGRLLSTGKSTAGQSPFIPVYFQMDGRPDMLPGTFADVYLRTTPIPDALVIPQAALIEEQGGFYAYVQVKGESFQKRELKLGARDGQEVQVLAGLREGERVVTRGAYAIKLSQASGTMPAHGHEH